MDSRRQVVRTGKADNSRPPGGRWLCAARNNSPAVKPAKPLVAATTSSPFPHRRRGGDSIQSARSATAHQRTEGAEFESRRAVEGPRVTKEAVSTVFGEEDPAAPGLQEALIKGRARAQVKPVQDRVSQTEAFLSRSRKKLETMIAEAEKIKANMIELEARIQDGERRLEVLQSEARFRQVHSQWSATFRRKFVSCV